MHEPNEASSTEISLGSGKANHPKFPKYLSAVRQKAIREGTVIEFKVTTPEGEELSANLRLKEDDIALFQEITELFQ